MEIRKKRPTAPRGSFLPEASISRMPYRLQRRIQPPAAAADDPFADQMRAYGIPVDGPGERAGFLYSILGGIWTGKRS